MTKLKKGSKEAKTFMAKLRGIRKRKNKTYSVTTPKRLKNRLKAIDAKFGKRTVKKIKRKAAKKISTEKHQDVKSHNYKINISGNNNFIFEYKVSSGGKFYVSSNLDLKGAGIKKIGNGQDHKRNLKTYLFTEKALKKIQNLFGKENTKYIESDY